ncbi:sentrin-specific protease 7 [Bombina bombina]|uniref:sentrin-specific protease 7 n=1 Tax=Bombina bombina TaxID=8345 RepID=UPI00235A5702|nr:sentrin-specific protease 7 [Bombina bombina]
MMEKQKKDSSSEQSNGRASGFKIPKKTTDAWSEDIQMSSPLSRLADSDFKNVTTRKRGWNSSYSSFNKTRNNIDLPRYTLGSPKCDRSEQKKSSFCEKEMRSSIPEAKKIATEQNGHQQTAPDKACGDVSNTSVSSLKDLNRWKNGRCNSGQEMQHLQKEVIQESKEPMKGCAISSISKVTQEKTYCHRRLEIQLHKSVILPTNVFPPIDVNSTQVSPAEQQHLTHCTNASNKSTACTKIDSEDSSRIKDTLNDRTVLDKTKTNTHHLNVKLRNRRNPFSSHGKEKLGSTEPIVLSSDGEDEECSKNIDSEIKEQLVEAKETNESCGQEGSRKEHNLPTYTVLHRHKNGQHSVSRVSKQDERWTEIERSRSLLKLIVYPPPPTKGGLCVTNEDLDCLEHGEFLNDVIIDFYLKYLLLEKFPKDFGERSHIFSSFFFKCLTRKDTGTDDCSLNISAAERRHQSVKTWTRDVDIFKKDFIFVPVNEKSHWYLVVICFPWLQEVVYEDRKVQQSSLKCNWAKETSNQDSVIVFNDRLVKEEETMEVENNCNSEIDDTTSFQSNSVFNEKSKEAEKSQHGKVCKRPCLLIFDSLRIGSVQSTVHILREYLKVEWKVKKKTAREFSRSYMRDFYPKVPKQNNSTDCGLYLLQYVETFFQKPIETFEPPMRLENWFPHSVVKNKREEIKDIILQLYLQQKNCKR